MEGENKYLEICSINVRGLHGTNMTNKIKGICNHFQNSSANLIFLLDTHLDQNSERNVQKYWEGECFFSNSSVNGYVSGIALLSQNIDMSGSTFKTDPNGRYAILRITILHRTYLIAAVYAPTHKKREEKKLFFQTLQKEIETLYQSTDFFMLLGDFNNTESSLLDKSSGKTHSENSFKFMKPLLSEYDLTDVWRSKYPDRRDFTFYSKNGHSRIDRIYIQSTSMKSVSSVKHKSFVYSDHSSVHVTLKDGAEKESGTKTWCLNQNLLNDQDYIAKITEFWKRWQGQKTRFTSLLKWWDQGKRVIKTMSISFSRKISKQKNKILKSLYKRLRNAENGNKIKHIKELKEKIKTLEIEMAKKHFLSYRVKWVDEGILGPDIIRDLKTKTKNINTVLSAKGQLLSNPKEIRTEFSLFYKNLYNELPTCDKAQKKLLCNFQKSVPDHKRDKANQEISGKELKRALHQLENGKSPGSDGLPVEFFKTFWNIMKDDLLEMCLVALEKGELPKSQREAIIICIPKKGDLTETCNWRPISLLNADYKILAKTISNRVSELLPSIISEEQTATVKGRKIRQNLIILRDFVETCKENKTNASLISLDQTKAFDRVNWKFLFKLLHKMNFGNNLTNCIKLLYTKISSCVKINGFLSDKFTIQQGVRQGCPLSPHLYIIVAEVLTHAINSNPSIKGITVGNHEIKTTHYADDNAALLLGDNSIYALFESIKIYEKATASLVNMKKTQALWLGRNAGREDKPLNLAWSSQSVTILGLPFGNNDVKPLIWESVLDKIKSILSRWEKYNLSLKAKSQVIKTLIVPNFLYPSNIYPMNDRQIKRITGMIEGFFWSNKRPKIPTAILQFPVHLGGLGLPNFKLFTQSLLLTWIRDIFENKNHVWKQFFLLFTNKYKNLCLNENIFKISISVTSITQSNLPFFYDKLLRAWINFTKNTRVPLKDPQLMKSEPLFHNKLLGNTRAPPWYFKSQHRISKIGDLFYKWIPKLMTHEQASEYYDLNISKYQFDKLTKTIPNEFKEAITNNISKESPDCRLNVWKNKSSKKPSPTPITNMSCKAFYDELSNFTMEQSQLTLKSKKTPHFSAWTEKTGHVNWKTIFNFMSQNQMDRKTTDVQFRMIHFSTFSRLKLFQAKISPSPICPRCLLKNESIEHIFIECSKTKEIWQRALLLMETICPNIAFPNTYKLVVTGFSDLYAVKDQLIALEDIRLAFFKATWIQRNKAIDDFQIIDGKKLLNSNLKRYIQFRQSGKFDKLPESLQNSYNLVLRECNMDAY